MVKLFCRKHTQCCCQCAWDISKILNTAVEVISQANEGAQLRLGRRLKVVFSVISVVSSFKTILAYYLYKIIGLAYKDWHVFNFKLTTAFLRTVRTSRV